jgi:hypothetical protein
MRKDRFTDEAVRIALALAEAKKQDAESFSEAYDFARCQRADGTFYGTAGTCRKGSHAGDGPARQKKSPEARAAARAAGGAKTSAKNARARVLKEELSKIKDSIKGKSPEEINKAIAGAAKRADKRAAAGEGKAASKPKKSGADEAASDRRVISRAAGRGSVDEGKFTAALKRTMARADEQGGPAKARADEIRAIMQRVRERQNNRMDPYQRRDIAALAKRMAKSSDEQAKKGSAAATPKPKKIKTDFRKDVEAGAAKRKARDEKIVARQNRDNELRASIKSKLSEQRALKKEIATLERSAKEAARRVKKDPSTENKDRLKRINAALRVQDRALAKSDREIDRMARERGRLAKQAERERMTPAQRREAARVRKIIKEQG